MKKLLTTELFGANEELNFSDEQFKFAINHMINIAKESTCKRSKCGSIIVDEDYFIIGEGYNSKPCNKTGECTKEILSPTFKSDKTCCVHSEQRSIMDCLARNPHLIEGSTLFFIRLDENNNPMKAGKPYCTICSKMALDVGIKWFCLWHEEGWVAYDSEYYNTISFMYSE